jgi:DNA-damage-inducible protein J
MAKTEFIRARVDEELKETTESLFSSLGLSMTEAITLFLKQCELHQGLPFEVEIPNNETIKSLK